MRRRSLSETEHRVASAHIYPVKALRGLERAEVDVARWGFVHDRRWMVVRPDGALLTQREYPVMATIVAEVYGERLVLTRKGVRSLHLAPLEADAERRVVRVWKDRVPALDAGPLAASWLSDALGAECGLVYLDDVNARPADQAFARPDDRTAFTDGFPVLLVNTASLAALNSLLRTPVPMNRFRPGIVVDGPAAWAEDEWRRIRVGDVVFRVASPCARCAVVTIDQMTGERPHKTEPLRTLGRIRRTQGGAMFGQNLIPENAGTITQGDRVEILEMGESNVRLLVGATP
jgi:uncharacterized protein